MMFTGIIDLQHRDSNYFNAADAAATKNSFVSASMSTASVSAASHSAQPVPFNLVATGEVTPIFNNLSPAIDFSQSNLLANFPSFSIIYGLGAIYLGAPISIYSSYLAQVLVR